MPPVRVDSPPMNEFRPGLEGVVAFETEIAEPDREGGVAALPRRRHRGARRPRAVREGVGPARRRVASSRAWPSPSRTSRSTSPATRPPTCSRRRRGCPPSGSSASSTRSPTTQAREDLRRLSAQMMAIVARSARVADGHTRLGAGRRRRAGLDGGREVPAALARRGRPAPREGDRHVLDLHRRARPQRLDLHRARRRLHRRRLRRRAVRGRRRALGPAARRRARVRDPDARRGRRAGRRRQVGRATRSTRASGSWASGTASTAPRIRARACSSGSRRSSARRASRSPTQLEQAALPELKRRSPDRVLATNVEFWSAVVLDIAEIPPPLAPAMFACSRVGGWSAHILEQKRTGRLVRPSARYVGPGTRARSPSVS